DPPTGREGEIMKRQSIIVAGALVIALGLGAGHVLSQEGGKHGEKPGEKQGEKPAGGEADMQAMMKLHEPGPHHKRLQALVGDWECKVITETGESTMGGQKYKMKGVTKIKDADHFSFEMFTVGPDGADMKNMELQYTRKK